MRFIYLGDFWVRKTGTIYPQQMFQRYPEIYVVGMPKQFFSSNFQLISEKQTTLWKLQGDILGSMV